VGRFRRRLGLEPAVPTGRFFGPGELRLALLALLAEAPGHGYDLMTRLEGRCGGAYQASAGAIYPTLQQLEDERLVRVEADQGRKTYELTVGGRRQLDGHADDVARIWARAASRSQWGVLRDPDAHEIVGPALRLAKAALKVIAHAHSDPTVIAEVRAILDDAREQIERLRRLQKRRGR
jgi:DNA-binding PadR family transcriptional regulator